MDEIMVVEIAETDPRGLPWGKVVQVAACRVDQETGIFESVLSESVRSDPIDLGKAALDRLSEVYGVNAESLYMGEDVGVVAERVIDAVAGSDCISFEVSTFGGFLCYEPWNLNGLVTVYPSMSRFLPAQAVPLEGEAADPLRKAYETMCPGDPVGVGGGKGAYERAQMSASVLAALIRAGLFRREPSGSCRYGQEYVPEEQQPVDYSEGYREEYVEYGDGRGQYEGGDYEDDDPQYQEYQAAARLVVLVEHPEPEQAEQAGYYG
ncbi:MAG: hypothetical protein IKR86_10295 [Candidatus Methanomethylophilaceae archaeon]|nr:hypothetical protein [Candidatus Methanomethylophilaceae archaeon]